MDIKKVIPNHILLEEVRRLIGEMWHKEFPQDFVKCTTEDREIYNSTKDFAYKTYIDILNNVDNALNNNNPDYQISDYIGHIKGKEFQMQQQQKLLNDIRNCDNIKLWCVDNIGTH